MANKDSPIFKLGEIMVQQGWIQWEQLEKALEIQRQTGSMMGDIAAKQGYVGKKEGRILFLGEILIRNGWISWEALEKALRYQQESGKILGDILLEKNWVTKENLYNALAIQHNLPFVKVLEFNIPPEALRLVPRHIALEQKVLPLLKKDCVLVIAISNPSRLVSHSDLGFTIDQGWKLHYALSCPEHLDAALQRYYPEIAA